MKIKLIIIISLLSLFVAGCSQNQPSVAVVPDEIVSENILQQKVDQGKVFKAFYTEQIASSGENMSIVISVKDKPLHLLESVVGSSATPINITVHENITLSSMGTQITTFNMNRSSSNDLSSKIYHSSSITDYSYTIIEKAIYGDNKVIGLTNDEKLHFILKPNTNYSLTIVNDNGNNLDVFANLAFYEE